jgi:peptidoglycan hydrolase-like protein with peptidoglycan-binding domain
MRSLKFPTRPASSSGGHRLSSRRRFSSMVSALAVFGAILAAEPVGPAFAQTDASSSSSSLAPSSPVPSAAPTTTMPSSSTNAPTSLVPPSTAPSSTTPTTTPATTPTTAPTTTSAPTTTPVTTQPSSTTSTVPFNQLPKGKTLKVGSKGEQVRLLEERLLALKIDTGKVDGRFDWSTWQGVVAFQKYWGLKRTGKVDNTLWQLMQDSIPLRGIISGGPSTRIEVDKSRQILIMYKADQVWRVVAISSGSGKKYCDISKKTGKKICGTAFTPTGRFKIQRRIPGWRESDLGRLYNPLYFNGGIAFHGAPSVPVYAASHGCVRLPMPVAEWFPSEVANGTAVYVYD